MKNRPLYGTQYHDRIVIYEKLSKNPIEIQVTT